MLVWVEDGCWANDDHEEQGYAADPAARVGEVQCCADTGSLQAQCSRAGCLSGNADDHMATYSEAVELCSSRGMRLCTKEETLSERAAGCCGTGCQYDNALV